jgi:hypothetical protein
MQWVPCCYVVLSVILALASMLVLCVRIGKERLYQISNYVCVYIQVSQEECARLRESVP